MPTVHVLGSLNVDIVARAPRLPGPGETVMGSGLEFSPGGKGANQAVAAARLGSPVAMLGAVGRDAFGDRLRETLAALNVDLSRLRVLAGVATGTALITVADSAENQITVIPGANMALTAASFASWQPQPGDVLLAQYEVPLPVVTALIQRARAAGATSIVNTAPAVADGLSVLQQADIAVFNESEAIAWLGAANALTGTEERIALNLRTLASEHTRWLVLTRGRSGAMAVGGNQAISLPGRRVAAVDTTGAGDCFCGALAHALAQGQDMTAALTYANVAASLSVQRAGAGSSMPTGEEVGRVMAGG